MEYINCVSVSAILLKVGYVSIVKHYVSVSPPLLSVEYVKISVKLCVSVSLILVNVEYVNTYNFVLLSRLHHS